MTEATEKLAIPLFLKQLRKQRGLTQPELAHAAGVSTTTIHNLEAGKNGFTDKTIKALSDALECPPAELFAKPAGKVSGEKDIKRLLATIEGLPEDAINPVWRLIAGYVEDAG